VVDVAVVGGGVIGLACAREIARAGVADVVVLESLPAVGQAASSRANGGFRAQFTTAPNIAFSLFSIGELEDLEQRTGLLSLHQPGYLFVTGTEDGERALRAACQLQRSLGVPTEWLSPDEVRGHAPFLRMDGVRAGTFHGRDGVLDPAGVVAAQAQEARAAGARILVHTPVTAIERDGTGWLLRHDGGPTRADVVVNAAGADAGDVAALAGAVVPVQPVRRHLAHALDPTGGPRTPMVVDLDTGVIARREPAGGWIIGYANPADPPGRDTTIDPVFFEDLAELVPNRFPFLEDLPMDPAQCWAGLYPETPDHHAIVGEDPAVPGLFECVGFGGHGVMHAPAAGRAIAELLASSRCDTFDLRPLRPSRFAEGDLVVETAVL